VNIGIFGQNCPNPNSSLKKSPNTIVGYYPAYKYNSTPDFSIINPSVTHINYIAFSPTDLTTNNRPYNVFNNSVENFNKLRDYKNQNQSLIGIKLILSVLLPINNDIMKISPFNNVTNGMYNSTDPGNQQFIGDLIAIVKNFSFDGIDIDYPYKMPCYQPTRSNIFNINALNSVFSQFLADISSKLKSYNINKILTITAGQNSIPNITSDITFVNILAFRLNINTTHASAGINDLQKIIDSWSYIDESKLVLGIELGGIIEVITLRDNNGNINRNINVDIAITSKNFAMVYNQNITFPSSSIDENIVDPCRYTSYAHLSWQNFNLLAPPCYTNTIQDSEWKYGFDNNSSQPYLSQRIPSCAYYSSVSSNQPCIPGINDNSQTYYYISYEDYQSLNAKFDLIKNNKLAGIAIPDITKDYSQLMNFISGNLTVPVNPTQPKSTISTISNNKGAIVGGVLGAVIFVGAIAADYINRQVRPDTHNRIYSDTNHQAF
ncbi:34836_t:CDS:2, partial [Gigaspora margarita]